MSKIKEVIKTLRQMQEVSDREVYRYMADALEKEEQRLSKAQAEMKMLYEEEITLLKKELEVFKKEVRIEGKAKSEAQALIKWHQGNYSKVCQELKCREQDILDLMQELQEKENRIEELERELIEGADLMALQIDKINTLEKMLKIKINQGKLRSMVVVGGFVPVISQLLLLIYLCVEFGRADMFNKLADIVYDKQEG